MTKPKLTELDIQRLNDATVVNGKATYYARAEMEEDVFRFLASTGYTFSVDMWFTRLPDRFIRFESEISYSALLGYALVPGDGHILARTLDVTPDERFYEIVCYDVDNTRAKMPKNWQTLREKVDEIEYDNLSDEKRKLIRVMNGGWLRQQWKKAGEEFPEDVDMWISEEDIETFPEGVDGNDLCFSIKYGLPPSKVDEFYRMRLFLGTYNYSYKTIQRLYKRLNYLLNVELDYGICIRPLYGKDQERYPCHWDVIGTQDQLSKFMEKFYELKPKRLRFNKFIASHDDEWEQKYPYYL